MLAETHVVLRGVELKLFLVILYVFKAYFACFSKDKKCILFSNFREAHAQYALFKSVLVVHCHYIMYISGAEVFVCLITVSLYIGYCFNWYLIVKLIQKLRALHNREPGEIHCLRRLYQDVQDSRVCNAVADYKTSRYKSLQIFEMSDLLELKPSVEENMALTLRQY
jgi:hypothetical protein